MLTALGVADASVRIVVRNQDFFADVRRDATLAAAATRDHARRDVTARAHTRRCCERLFARMHLLIVRGGPRLPRGPHEQPATATARVKSRGALYVICAAGARCMSHVAY